MYNTCQKTVWTSLVIQEQVLLFLLCLVVNQCRFSRIRSLHAFMVRYHLVTSLLEIVRTMANTHPQGQEAAMCKRTW